MLISIFSGVAGASKTGSLSWFPIEEIASCDEKKLKAIEGFDENLIKELKDRAKKNLDKKIKDLEVKKNDLNLSKDLEKVKQFSLENLVALGEKNIKTLDDLADLSSDELIDIIGSENIKKSDADKIIMDSRKKWFSEEDKSTNK